MAKKTKNVLMSMTANEKRYMRLVSEKLKGVYPPSEIPERKREALEEYREKVRKHCSPCVSEIADREVERLERKLNPAPRIKKTAVKEEVEE